MPRTGVFYALSFLIATITLSPSAHAQNATAAAPSVDIETLVVDHQHRPVGDLKAAQFSVAIDDHTAINPSSVRSERTEPVALMVLIDVSRDSFHTLASIGEELAALTPDYLLPSDSVSVYAADCHMVRSLYNASPNKENVRKAVSDAMTAPSLHDGKSGSACGKSMHLWDDVAAAILALSKLPGHRVLLVVSEGEDGASKYDWRTVKDYAFSQSVAVFGLRDQRQVDADTFTRNSLSTTRSTGAGNTIAPGSTGREANPFELLCANAGGLILNYEPLLRKETLAYLLFILRNRYILEISADAYPAGKEHRLKVTVPLTPYFVSVAGAEPAQAP